MIMTTRIGKIGRLPKSIREELGRRIEDGVPGTEIVQWLNTQPDVLAVMAKYFEGRPVTEQNLSDWKESGHVDWVRLQEARTWAGRLTEQAEELATMTGDNDLTDVLAMMLAVQIGQAGSQLVEQSAEVAERWERLCKLNRELSILRRDEDRRERTNHQWRRWEWQMDRQNDQDEEAGEQKRREQRLDRYVDRMGLKEHAEFVGARAAERLYRIKHGLSEEDLNDGTWQAEQEKRKAEKRKHSTLNIQHSTSKEKAKSRRPRAGGRGCAMAEGTRYAALRRGKKGKWQIKNLRKGL